MTPSSSDYRTVHQLPCLTQSRIPVTLHSIHLRDCSGNALLRRNCDNSNGPRPSIDILRFVTHQQIGHRLNAPQSSAPSPLPCSLASKRLTGNTAHRMPPTGRNFGERLQHEDALRHAGMWQHQRSGAGQRPASTQAMIVDDVKIQRARSPAHAAAAASGALDHLQADEQRLRRKMRRNSATALTKSAGWSCQKGRSPADARRKPAGEEICPTRPAHARRCPEACPRHRIGCCRAPPGSRCADPCETVCSILFWRCGRVCSDDFSITCKQCAAAEKASFSRHESAQVQGCRKTAWSSSESSGTFKAHRPVNSSCQAGD